MGRGFKRPETLQTDWHPHFQQDCQDHPRIIGIREEALRTGDSLRSQAIPQKEAHGILLLSWQSDPSLSRENMTQDRSERSLMGAFPAKAPPVRFASASNGPRKDFCRTCFVDDAGGSSHREPAKRPPAS